MHTRKGTKTKTEKKRKENYLTQKKSLTKQEGRKNFLKTNKEITKLTM